MHNHPSEEQIAAYVSGTVSGDAAHTIEGHLAGCDPCQTVAGGYRQIVAGLQYLEVPAPVLEAARTALKQRLRLRRFVERLLSDAPWRAQVHRDPHGALEQYQIRPTPQLMAALKELESDREVSGTQLDERVSKLLLGL